MKKMGQVELKRISTERDISRHPDQNIQLANRNINVQIGGVTTDFDENDVVELDLREDILHRLRSAVECLNKIIELITAGAPSAQVLRQSIAVQAKLRITSVRMLVYQAHQSKTIILESPCPEEIQAEIKRLCELYLILIQYSTKSEDIIS